MRRSIWVAGSGTELRYPVWSPRGGRPRWAISLHPRTATGPKCGKRDGRLKPCDKLTPRGRLGNERLRQGRLGEAGGRGGGVEDSQEERPTVSTAAGRGGHGDLPAAVWEPWQGRKPGWTGLCRTGQGGRTAVSAQGLWRSFAVKGRRETGQRFKQTWVVLLQVRQMLSG